MDFTNKQIVIGIIIAFIAYKIFFKKEGYAESTYDCSQHKTVDSCASDMSKKNACIVNPRPDGPDTTCTCSNSFVCKDKTKYDCSKHTFDCANNEVAKQFGCSVNPNPEINAGTGMANIFTNCKCNNPSLCRDKLKQVVSGSVTVNADQLGNELIKIQNDYIVNNANPTLTNMYNDFLNETDATNKKTKVDALVSYYNNTYAPLFTQGIDSGFDANGNARGPNGLKKGDIRSKNAESLFKILGGNYSSKYITYTSLKNQTYK